MATPKKILKSIQLNPPKILQQRREELLGQIQQDGTYLPKGIYHADLDRGMLDFVKNDLGISVDGKKVNTIDVLITTQNWAQFTQTWNFNDLDNNISPPFIATVRKPETPYGTNQGANYYRIPGKQLFQYSLVPNFDGTRNGFDVYKIPQPIPVDITYEVKIFCNRMREINALNKKVLEKFSSRQAYTLIKGRYLPIIMDSISDESVVELQKRRYYIQNYTFKLLGILLDEEQFEVAPAVSRILTMYDVSTKTRKKSAESLKQNENTIVGLLPFLNNNNSIIDISSANYDYNLISTENISTYDVLINGNLIGTDLEFFQLNTNDTLRVNVTKTNVGQDANILFDVKIL